MGKGGWGGGGGDKLSFAPPIIEWNYVQIEAPATVTVHTTVHK